MLYKHIVLNYHIKKRRQVLSAVLYNLIFKWQPVTNKGGVATGEGRGGGGGGVLREAMPTGR